MIRAALCSGLVVLALGGCGKPDVPPSPPSPPTLPSPPPPPPPVPDSDQVGTPVAPTTKNKEEKLPPLEPLPPLADESRAPSRAAATEGNTSVPQEEVDRVFALFLKCQAAGHDFVTGRKPDALRDELMACAKDEPDVFNLVFTWTYKKKSKNYPVQHALYSDAAHMNVRQTKRSTVKEGVNITAGFTEDDRPIWIASKYYAPPPDDKNNLGGEIMLLLLAKEKK